MAKKSGLLTISFFIVLTSIFFRIWHLSWVPGLNGDETWYGNVSRLILHGQRFPLQTPNGNWLNPFFFFPHLFLAILFEPQFWVLRLVPLCYGLLTLAFTLWLARRLFGPRQALACLLVVACLPINIAYSRFNWDPSLSFLIDLCLLGACLRTGPFPENAERGFSWDRQIFWHFGLAPVVLLAALIVHPTNLFILPAACVICLLAHERPLKSRLVQIGILCAIAGFFAILNPALQTHQGEAGLHFERLLQWEAWKNYSTAFGRYFWGLAVTTYVAGPPASIWFTLCDYFLTPLMIGGWLVSLVYFALKKQQREISFALAAMAPVACAFVTVGGHIFMPHFERYGVFTLPPMILWIGTWTRSRAASTVIVIFCGLLLFSFYENYFEPLIKEGGHSHRTFHTARPEPKQQVYDKIRELQSHGPVTVFADDWWIAQPLSYLASADPRFKVIQLDELNLSDTEITNQLIQCAIFVTFNGSPANQRLHQSTEAYLEATIRDPQGTPIFDIQTCNKADHSEN
jgi:4-amino-4-deoxy-L-arabinose transferase-like glycosyltransferase